MPATRQEKKLKKLLGGVVQRLGKYGTRSPEVKKYLKRYRRVPEFPELASTVILLAEAEDYKHKVDAPVGDGSGPMPNTWGKFLRWATTPYRVFLAIANAGILAIAVGVGRFSPRLGHPWRDGPTVVHGTRQRRLKR